VNRNVKLLYGFSFFDQFMIVIAVLVPYLTTLGISMRQFMELQAVFALVIFCGEIPSGTALGPVGQAEDAAARLGPQGRELFPSSAVEHLRRLLCQAGLDPGQARR
jgi:hypothetical protein